MLENKRDYSKEAAKSGVVRGGHKSISFKQKGTQGTNGLTNLRR